eukprot:IDg4908t1
MLAGAGDERRTIEVISVENTGSELRATAPSAGGVRLSASWFRQIPIRCGIIDKEVEEGCESGDGVDATPSGDTIYIIAVQPCLIEVFWFAGNK